MKPLSLLPVILFGALIPFAPAYSQQSAQRAEIIRMPTGETLLRWFAHQGRTYFIQASDPNNHLTQWIWSDSIERGSGAEISYEVGGTADKGFFRLHYTDAIPPVGVTLEEWDADGDGLANALELSLQSHPLNPDTSGDGIPDGWAYAHQFPPTANVATGSFQGSSTSNLGAYQLGVQADPNASLADYDADGRPNGQDADPLERLVDWKPAATSGYVLLDVGGPNDVAEHLTDKCEVMVGNGVWDSGVWTEFPSFPTRTGMIEDEEYEVSFGGPVAMNNSRQFVGYSRITFIESESENNYVNTSYMYGGGAAYHFVDALGIENFFSTWGRIKPLDIDGLGRGFSLYDHSWVEAQETISESYILVSDGTLLSPSNGYWPQTGSGGHFAVSQSGYVVCNTVSSLGDDRNKQYRIALWGPGLSEIPLPAAANGWFHPLRLTDMPDNKVALVGSTRTNYDGFVFLGSAQTAVTNVASLTGKQIRQFAGNGTAMTRDSKIWLNGTLVPLGDLCPEYDELLESYRYAAVRSSNKHGAFLIDGGTTGNHLLIPCGIVADTDRDGTIKLPADLSEKNEWNDERGAIYTVNFDRENTRQHSSAGGIYTDSITWGNLPGSPIDENWQVDSEADVDDITPFLIDVGSLPTGTKVYLKATQQEAVHAIHVFPRRKANQMAIWGGFQQNGQPWTDGDAEPKDIEITSWLRPQAGEPGYNATETGAVPGTYEFGLEGLVFRGMSVPSGTLAGGKFSGEIELSVEIETPWNNERKSGGSIRLKVAPFLLTHNERPTTRVFVADVESGLQAMPSAHVVTNKFPTQWFQDHAEIGYTQRPGGPLVRTALLLPRDGALPQWPLYEFLNSGRAVFTLGNNLGGGGGDFGGNVELSSPLPSHPLGRVLAGNSMGNTLLQFLTHQEKQQPLTVNVDHTEVLHVDEVLSPGPNGTTYIPDPAAAISLLQQTFNTPEKQIGALLFSPDTQAPLVATVWRSSFSPQTRFVITHLEYDAVISQWSRIGGLDGGYMRLVGGTSGGQVAKIVGLSKATAADANKLNVSDNPAGKLMIEVEAFYDTGSRAATNWKITKPFQEESWFRSPQQGARIVCVEKTRRWTSNLTTPAIISVWEVLQDTDFVTFNSTTLPNLIQASVSAAGIGNTVGLPCLFYRSTRQVGLQTKEYGIAFTPNAANLQWVNGNPVHPSPYGPRPASGSDALQSRIQELSQGTSQFLNCWNAFHVLEGEIHCGSNAERSPPTSWWSEY